MSRRNPDRVPRDFPGREPYRSAAWRLLCESGCEIRTWRNSHSGVAHTNDPDWEISVPKPTGAISFAVFAHEVAHQMLHRGSSRPRWLEEIEAWEWALAAYGRLGLPNEAAARMRAVRSVRAVGSRLACRKATKPETLQAFMQRAAWAYGD